MLALSATYPPELATAVQMYMRSPVHVRLNSGAPSLDGVSQFYAIITSPTAFNAGEEKTVQVLGLLEMLRFRQCIVFCNLRSKAQQLCEAISARGK